MIADFVNGHIPDFVWALAAFVVFVLILFKVGLKPVAAALDAREAKLARELKESEEAYAKARALKDQLDAQMRNAEAKIGEMMAEARRDGEALKAQLVEHGRGELDAVRTRSLREIEAARAAAIIGLRAEVADIATQVAEKIVRQNLDARRNDDLVGAAIEAYEAQQARK
jgi:F-type H+-transporting ATPase subunit b